MNKPTLVIYHGECVDGFTAAWVARDGLSDRGIAEVEFRPAAYGEEAPDVTGRDVYVLDFSWRREEMLRMKEQAKGMAKAENAYAEKADEVRSFCAGEGGGARAIVIQWIPCR